MRSEWPLMPVGSVATIVTKGTTPTTLGFDYQEDGICFVKVESIADDGSLIPEKLAYISADADAALARSRLHPDDVLFTIAGTIGRVALVPSWLIPANTNQAVAIIRPDTSKVLPRFLRYGVATKAFVLHASSRIVQGVQANFSLGELKAGQIRLPPMMEQAAVCEVLGSLDDRIDNLRTTNATLEAIAQALFKSWFVDFDPVHAKAEGRAPAGMDAATAALFPSAFEDSELGPIPKGWRVDAIGRVVQCVGGATPSTKNDEFWCDGVHHWATPKDLSGLSAPVLTTTERLITDAGVQRISSGLLPAGTLLMSSRAPVGYLAIAAMPTAINQGFIAMPPGGALPPSYLLWWAKQNMDAIKQAANGSTFMEISKRAFKPMLVCVPAKSVIEAFEALIDPVIARITANLNRAETTASLRDTLLPRLISGKLRLPEARATVEEATA